MKREAWKKHSQWRKDKARRLRELRNILRFGFPIEKLWNGRIRNGNGAKHGRVNLHDPDIHPKL